MVQNQQNQNKGKAHVPPGLIERVEIIAVERMTQPEKVDDPMQQSPSAAEFPFYRT